MIKKKTYSFLITGLFLVAIITTFIQNDSQNLIINQDDYYTPNISASIEGMDDILITNITRQVEVNGYGLLNIKDYLVVRNNYNNPITSIFVGVPISHSEDLIFYKAVKSDGTSSLLVERSSYISKGYEMVAIYFDSPLLPGQERNICYIQSYKDLIQYLYSNPNQYLYYFNNIYPILPYRSEGIITSTFSVPDTATELASNLWGDVSGNTVFFDLSQQATYLDPFSENLGDYVNTSLHFIENTFTKLEVNKITREIYLSPWGIIKVTENFEIENYGYKSYSSIPFNLPAHATGISLKDDLGEILGTTIEDSVLTIDLTKNRAALQPNTKIKFTLSYNLPFENHFSVNWFQESIKLDILTTTYDFLGKGQTITIIIDGCFSLDSNTADPDAIQITPGATKIIYESDYVCPLETKLIQFTFTIDVFDLILRPLVFMLIITSIATAFVLLSKSRFRKDDTAILQREIIPVHEIREFCSLYEEKNALVYEIRNAEEDAKKKKLAKKNYKNILNKNTIKIEEIEREIIQFKKLIMEASPTFEKLVRRLDELDAERMSVKDSLDLLDARYKRGKLPSKAAYMKLLDDFIKRRKKIDRSLDKIIQQLRSYLL